MASQSKMNEHRFCCLNCGRTGIPLGRPESHRREKFHRKKLYCPWCKRETQHVEIRDSIEAQEFQELFESNYFAEENKESLEFLSQNSSIWLS